MNWEHEKIRNGPFVGLAKAVGSDANWLSMIWYDQPANAKDSFKIRRPFLNG